MNYKLPSGRTIKQISTELDCYSLQVCSMEIEAGIFKELYGKIVEGHRRLRQSRDKVTPKEKKINAEWQITKHRWGFDALQTWLQGRDLKSSGIRSGSWR